MFIHPFYLLVCVGFVVNAYPAPQDAVQDSTDDPIATDDPELGVEPIIAQESSVDGSETDNVPVEPNAENEETSTDEPSPADNGEAPEVSEDNGDQESNNDNGSSPENEGGLSVPEEDKSISENGEDINTDDGESNANDSSDDPVQSDAENEYVPTVGSGPDFSFGEDKIKIKYLCQDVVNPLYGVIQQLCISHNPLTFGPVPILQEDKKSLFFL